MKKNLNTSIHNNTKLQKYPKVTTAVCKVLHFDL